MKRIITALLALMLIAACCAQAEGRLVVCFSRAGGNYNVGSVQEGNTLKMARLVAEEAGADLFEIVPAVPYPESYEDCLNVATEEQRTNARPEYQGDIES